MVWIVARFGGWAAVMCFLGLLYVACRLGFACFNFWGLVC